MLHAVNKSVPNCQYYSMKTCHANSLCNYHTQGMGRNRNAIPDTFNKQS